MWGEKMTIENFDQTLNLLTSRVPFHPFTVAMVNGDRFEVDYPKALAFRDGAAMFFAPGGVPVIFDHESVSQFVGDLMGKENA